MKLTKENLIMAIALIVLAIYTFQLKSENDANEKALESLKTKKEAELKQLSIEIDSITRVAENYRKSAEKDYDTAVELEVQKEDLKNTEYEKEPYTFTNADSLRDVIARRYYNR